MEKKFISRLPTLFVDKVRNRLKQWHRGFIPYSQYSYGELASEVVLEGINLCNDINLKRQLKKQKLTNKQALGDFCHQFGYEDFRTSTK